MERPAILVVDDEEDICANMEDILSEFGYEVVTANNGEDAIESARARFFDLALLDLKMPGMDGLTLFHELQRISPDTDTLLVTAYATDETARKALEAGVLQVVPKPVDISELLQCIGDVVSRPLLLVVDDDSDLCANLRDILSERQYRVSVATNVDEALKKIDQSSWQVMLLDVCLPEGNGFELIEETMATKPDARVLMITGLEDEEEQLLHKALNAGAKGLCRKPLDVPALLLKIDQMLG